MASFFGVIFFDYAKRQLDFLVEVGGDRRGSEEEVWPFFSGSVQLESELSSIYCRGRFD